MVEIIIIIIIIIISLSQESNILSKTAYLQYCMAFIKIINQLYKNVK